MPSFAYPTMATAVVRQGATPVFVDVDPRTLNLDPARVEAAVGPRTKAIVAVHYGGVGCEMDELLAIAAPAALTVIEDAAHCLLAELPRPAAGRDRRPRRLQLPRDQERDLRRGRRAAGQQSGAARAGGDRSGRRAPTGPASCAARSTATPGSTSAPPSAPASSPPPSSGASWRRPTRSPRGGGRSGSATTRPSPSSRPRGWCSGRRVPPPARPTTATSTTWCCRPRPPATPLSPSCASRESSPPSTTCPLHSSPAGRRFGRTVGSLAQHRGPQPAAGAAAALARPRRASRSTASSRPAARRPPMPRGRGHSPTPMDATPSDAELREGVWKRRCRCGHRRARRGQPPSLRVPHQLPARGARPDLEDGGRARLAFKRSTGSELDEEARLAKPRFLHDPLREPAVYASVLAAAPRRPPRAATARWSNRRRGRHWLFIEWVEGRELYQVGERQLWEAAARLARHDARRARPASSTAIAASGRLLDYDAPSTAAGSSGRASSPRAPGQPPSRAAVVDWLRRAPRAGRRGAAGDCRGP